MELGFRKMDTKQEKSLYSIKNAGFFQRLVAFLFDLIIIFFLNFTLSVIAIVPISNHFGYDDLVQEYNAQLLEFNLGEYDENNEFVIFNFDDINQDDLQAFYDDPEAKAISNRKYVFDLIQISAGLFIAEIIVMFIVPLLFKNGQTLGKKLMKLGLVDNYGLRVKPMNVFVRFLIGWFVFETAMSLITMTMFGLPIFILVSMLMLLLTKNKRALHDVIGSTIVVSLDKMVVFDSGEERQAAIQQERMEREAASKIE